MFLQDENLPGTILQRDLDTKNVQAFDDVFTGEGRTIKKTPIKSPNVQAFFERVIQTLKHEVLNGFCVINERHLDHVLKIKADWYSKRGRHSSCDHLSPVRDEGEPPKVDLAKHRLVCHTELGGHLKSYRAARDQFALKTWTASAFAVVPISKSTSRLRPERRRRPPKWR